MTDDHTRVQGLRAAAAVLESILEDAYAACVPGAMTLDIDRAVERAIKAAGATSLFKGYRQGNSPPFPACTCIAVNDEVVHGIPSTRLIEPGDAVSIDVGIRSDGWCADSGSTLLVPGGDPDLLAARHALITQTRAVLDHAVKLAKPGARWSTIAKSLEDLTLDSGYRLVEEYVGHAIGTNLHEPPKVPSYWSGFAGEDFTLTPGMVLAIEPMLVEPADHPAPQRKNTAQRAQILRASDGWTVSTRDKASACHEEFMVLITDHDAEVLTPRARAPLTRDLSEPIPASRG